MKTYTVLWVPKAERSYEEILEYLKKNWTAKEVSFFIERTERVINLIGENPYLYPYSKSRNPLNVWLCPR